MASTAAFAEVAAMAGDAGRAAMLHALMQGRALTASELEPPRKHLSVGPRDAALRQARTCYDHLAGRIGVSLSDALTSAGYAELSDESGVITERGLAFLERVGIDISAMRERSAMKSGRLLCPPCLDWSERRSHLAGVVGAALCAHSLAEGLVCRIEGTRALQVTPKGLRVYRDKFGI